MSWKPTALVAKTSIEFAGEYAYLKENVELLLEFWVIPRLVSKINWNLFDKTILFDKPIAPKFPTPLKIYFGLMLIASQFFNFIVLAKSE